MLSIISYRDSIISCYISLLDPQRERNVDMKVMDLFLGDFVFIELYTRCSTMHKAVGDYVCAEVLVDV